MHLDGFRTTSYNIPKCFKTAPTCNPKISIVFEEKIMKKLIKEAKKRKRSVAYLVRQAVNQYYET